MNAKPLLVLAALLLLVPPGLAQTPQGQLEEATDKAKTTAEDAIQNPDGFAANATNESWREEQANWTLAWSCSTAYATDEDAGDLVAEATGCPSPDDAQAGPEPEEDENKSTAEPADDAETALRDLIAAVLAFGDDVQEDPEETPKHATTLVNRTLTVLERLVEALTSEVPAAFTAGQGKAQALLHEAEDLLKERTREASSLLDSATKGLQAVAHGAEDTITHVAQHATTAAVHVTDTTGETVHSSLNAASQATTSIYETTSRTLQTVTETLQTLAPGDLAGGTETPREALPTSDRAAPSLELPTSSDAPLKQP